MVIKSTEVQNVSYIFKQYFSWPLNRLCVCSALLVFSIHRIMNGAIRQQHNVHIEVQIDSFLTTLTTPAYHGIQEGASGARDGRAN